MTCTVSIACQWWMNRNENCVCINKHIEQNTHIWITMNDLNYGLLPGHRWSHWMRLEHNIADSYRYKLHLYHFTVFFSFSVYILQFSYWFAAAAVIVVVFLLQFCSDNFPCMKTESINWDKHFYLFSWDSCSFQCISSIYCSVLCIFLLVFFVCAFLSEAKKRLQKMICACLCCVSVFLFF